MRRSGTKVRPSMKKKRTKNARNFVSIFLGQYQGLAPAKAGDMNFNSTTASFTVSAEPWASLSCANLPADSAFYDVSVRRLTALLQASFPRYLAAPQLPFASNYCMILPRKNGHKVTRIFCTLFLHTRPDFGTRASHEGVLDCRIFLNTQTLLVLHDEYPENRHDKPTLF